MQYCVEISNGFASVEDLNVEGDINNAWKTIRRNIITEAKESPGYFEVNVHKPWFTEGYSRL